MKSKLILVCIILFTTISLSGQSLRLSIKKGGSIGFYFNTLYKYENGVEYLNFTRIAVAFSEYGAPKDSTWQMQIKALTATLEANGTNTLPLNVIRVATSDGGSTTPATLYSKDLGGVGLQGWITLTNAYQQVVSGGPEGAFTDNLVDFSWDCGVTNSVKGESADYYVVDIDLLLSID